MAVLRVDIVQDSRSKGLVLQIYHYFIVLSTQTYQYREALEVNGVQNGHIFLKYYQYVVGRACSGATRFRSKKKNASPADFDNDNHGITNNQTLLAVISCQIFSALHN